MRLAAEAVAQAFRAACIAELEAPKPGNVHAFAAGHGMTAEDFVASAEAAAVPLSTAGARVGKRILGAVVATMTRVGTNTNLGIVLLCAPLAAAVERPERPLSAAVEQVLLGLDRTDAAAAFEAIILAEPAGLGSAERFDVHDPPTCTLREAMVAAADRDRIARAYADGFADVFGLGWDTLAAARRQGGPQWWHTTAVYLAFLAGFADSHIARKYGSATAEDIRREAVDLSVHAADLAEDERLALLMGFDRSLKQRSINPGTSADLCVATLFADRLRDNLRRGRSSG